MTGVANAALHWLARMAMTFLVVIVVLVGLGYARQRAQSPECAPLAAIAVNAEANSAAAALADQESEDLWTSASWYDPASMYAWWIAKDKADDFEDTAQELKDKQASLEELCGPAETYGPVGLVRAQLPVAFWVVIGVIAIPVFIKVVFYFWLAPRAERLPPIRISPGASVPSGPRPQPSAVSTSVELGSGDELLLHPDFVQSSDRSARKQTQWLLNPRLPLSSLASGMVSLTRIRAPDRGTAQVVVSSQKDSLSEVAVVEIPAGAGMVIQPRSLAGIVKRIGSPVKITAEWRLRSLNSWLTLQFRYLVFHGPCKLIVKGCRGVRAEQPESSKPRLINQAATLGFSANLDYSIARCETFVSYLRGQEDLFNDLFSGGPGWFIYEEVPDSHETTGVTGKGLEGVVDAFLKAFGI